MRVAFQTYRMNTEKRVMALMNNGKRSVAFIGEMSVGLLVETLGDVLCYTRFGEFHVSEKQPF